MELIDVTPELNLYDKTGRSGPTRSNCRPPSSSSTTRAAAAWRSIRWSPAAASSSGATVRRSLLFSNVRVSLRIESQDCGGVARRGNRRALPRCTKVRGRQGLPHPRRHCHRRATRKQDAKRFYVSEEGVVLVTPEMLGQKFTTALMSASCDRLQGGAVLAHAPAGISRSAQRRISVSVDLSARHQGLRGHGGAPRAACRPRGRWSISRRCCWIRSTITPRRFRLPQGRATALRDPLLAALDRAGLAGAHRTASGFDQDVPARQPRPHDRSLSAVQTSRRRWRIG